MAKMTSKQINAARSKMPDYYNNPKGSCNSCCRYILKSSKWHCSVNLDNDDAKNKLSKLSSFAAKDKIKRDLLQKQIIETCSNNHSLKGIN